MNERAPELETLASELALVQGALFNLIVALYKTQLSPTQAALVSAVDLELAESQRRFKATYSNAMQRSGEGEELE